MNAMRGNDEDTGEYLGPSRSELRRDALAVLTLAHSLMEQPAARLAQLPLGEDLLKLALASQRIGPQIARKRQTQFLAKILRREGYPQPYEALKALTRGRTNVTKEALHDFIDGLYVGEEVKEELKMLTPHNYVGQGG